MNPNEEVDPDKDEIFISGLPTDITEEEVAEYFGQIGVIKEDKKRRGQPKIWLYRDKATGELKGEATVTYEDPFAAASAPSWFNDKEYKGKSTYHSIYISIESHILKVSLSDRKATAAAAYAAKTGGYGGGGGGGGNRGGGGGRDRGGGGSGGLASRPGDWTCPNCNNLCFARKDQCNRCGTPKPGGSGAGGGGDRYGRDRDRDRSPGRGPSHHRDSERRGNDRPPYDRRDREYDRRNGDREYHRNRH